MQNDERLRNYVMQRLCKKESNIFMQENENPLRYMQDPAMQLLYIFSNVIDVLKASNVTNS